MDLASLSGLPITLDDAGKVHFDPEVVIEETRVRLIDELALVCLDREACLGNRQPAYFMYNGVYLKGDEPRLEGLSIRYELTLFPEFRIGHEFGKTLGHIHIAEPNSGIDYPEICEVLVGTAHFFFQTLDVQNLTASRAFYLEVKEGQKIVIPPGYDHLTINPGSGVLLFSDVIAADSSGIYDRFKTTRGAAYFEIEQNGEAVFIPNPYYRSIPPLEKMVPRDYPEIGLMSDKPLYTSFVEDRGKNWIFLTQPQLFKSTFPNLSDLFQVKL